LALYVYQVKIQGQNEEMLLAACEQFLGKQESEIQHIALVTLEGHQRAIMGSMTVEVCVSVLLQLFSG
jgi:flotillin